RVGGKRLRPFLMQEIYTMCGGTKKIVEPFMAALEMIHTYSLVHDDLPEMDDDELRRGMPTTHKKYGQAMGVLAGDGLLNYAMETAMRAFDLCSQQDNENIIKALQVLFNKSGIYGMIGGQTLDVEAEKTNHELELGELLFIDENKTAALLEAALMCGAILAGADEKVVDQFEKVGSLVGTAFQIQDDILDITSTTQVLGKPVGSDERNHKKTYVTYYGLEEAKKDQERFSLEAISMLDSYGTEATLTLTPESEEAKQIVIALIRRLVSRKM
ncbi:MAG TPA: polyprenyl synthetase family protein, partial [Lachnospiraceae bacterium]|nr:polyprenyl synthetase family protein [Lachnospiraceae bacterium]